jgi:hypothetical protein
MQKLAVIGQAHEDIVKKLKPNPITVSDAQA